LSTILSTIEYNFESELSHMAGAVDDSTINIVEVIIIIIIIINTSTKIL